MMMRERKRESNGAAVVYRTQSELNATTNTFLLLLLIYCYSHQEYFFYISSTLELFSQTGFFEKEKFVTVDQHSVVLFEISTLGPSSKVLQLQTIEQPGCMFLFFANQLISSIPSCIAAE